MYNAVEDGSQFYLYGSPIGNSPSPLLHNTGFETLGIAYRYQLCDTKDIKQVVISLRNRRTGGGSVTMPHKQTVMPFLDHISEAAKAIGTPLCITLRSPLIN
jgi:pentafunctional AROM polypeptide